jgi:Alr-MurF fusion protein
MILFSQLTKLTKGTQLSFGQDVELTHLITDSRKAVAAVGAVFFAIRGERHNGHAHIQSLYQQGIRNFIVEEEIAIPGSSANVLLVSSTITVLQQIVAFHRNSFSIPIIGVTGSNGKTIVKEWLYQVLSHRFVTTKNPGSYNSQIGVPLSVWQLQSYHTLGIFEAGISKPNEMQKLQTVIKPTIGVFTNIGSAHNEGFQSQEEKIREKLLLFQDSTWLVYCKDHLAIDQQVKSLKTETLSWGFSATADIVLTKENDRFRVVYQKEAFVLYLPFSDAASIENCFHCVAVLLHFSYSSKEIQTLIQTLNSVARRLELKEAINNCQLIDDSYNNDLAGLQISLDFLQHQHQKKKKHLILSDIQQTGIDSVSWIKQIQLLLEQHHINRFTGIGKELCAHKHLFFKTASLYESTEHFLNGFKEEDFNEEIILLKGARLFAFERIAERLQKKVHGTLMEIDLGAVVYNLNFFRSCLQPSTKIMAMVKAFAYGSGSTEVANLMQYHQVDYLGVAYPDEGAELRKNNIRLPIMVLNPTPESFDKLLRYTLEPELYNFSILQAFAAFLSGREATIHIKIDTGMHRLGFHEKQLPELVRLLAENSNLKVASVFSHLAGADEAQHDDYSHEQAKLFVKLATQLTTSLGYKPLYHLVNSPGILRLPQYQFDMVRLGIGLYGVDPTEQGNASLKPVATLKTVISQINTLKKGDTVGYGRHGKITADQKIATVAIGYADGYSRAFSKGVGEMLVKNKRSKIVGNVCMDMTMIDITDIDAREGDEVIVFGNDLPIQEVAAKINTIPYEILTNTSERVKRVFVAEGI